MQLENIVIKYTDEASEKTREECCPGSPYMNFSVKAGISVCIINPQRCSGLFRTTVKIMDADSVADINLRISKENKNIKSMCLLISKSPIMIVYVISNQCSLFFRSIVNLFIPL